MSPVPGLQKILKREVRTMSSKISRRQFLKTSAAVAGGAALMATPIKHAHSQNVIKWRGQTCYSSTVSPFGPFKQGETGLFAVGKQWTEWLYKRTNGRLVIDWAEPGSIFPITEADKAVAQGVVQISLGLGSFYAGRMPETDIELGGVFFWEHEAECYECLHKYGLFNLLQKTYAKHGLYWVPCHVDAMVGIGTIFPAPDPASIKGKKIRTTGVWGEYVQMLGGTPVSIPWGDVYMAAKLGTIDGWLAGIASLEEVKLKEVAKGVVVSPSPNSALSSFIINKSAYEKLPKDIQEILQNESPHWSYFAAHHWRNQCLWVMHNAQKQYGVKVYNWSMEDTNRLTKMAVETIYPKLAAKSADCDEMVKVIKQQMKDYGRL
jgi:TRAP-type C4-dicarboxylate transport system substrate-binding protein